MAQIRVAHFSDIHMAMAPNGSTINGNRFFSWGRWIATRRHHHSTRRLDRAVDIIIENKPDLAICTGDLTHMGQPHELEAASDKLNRLTENGIPLLLTGGNHDHYNRAASQEITRLQEKHGLGLQIDNEGLCQVNGLTILLMHQAIYNPFYMARGKLQQEPLEGLKRRFQSGEITEIHLSAGHYPVCDAAGKAISIRKRMGGDTRLKHFLLDRKIPAYLCGHCHTPFSVSLGAGCIQYCSGSITSSGVLRFLTYTDGKLTEEQTPTIAWDKT